MLRWVFKKELRHAYGQIDFFLEGSHCKKSQNISINCSQRPYNSGLYEDAERGTLSFSKKQRHLKYSKVVKQFLDPHLPHRGLAAFQLAKGDMSQMASMQRAPTKCLKYPEYHFKKKTAKNMKRTGLQLPLWEGISCPLRKVQWLLLFCSGEGRGPRCWNIG